mgnify:CR=1 FL=1
MIKRKIKIISIFCLLISCSPQQRLNHLLHRHPHLSNMSADTLKMTDTLRIESVTHDTTTIFQRYDTTIIMNTEKIFAKYVFDTITKEIHHEIKCIGDTIFYYKEIPYEVQKIVYQEKENNFKDYLVWGSIFLGLIILLIVIKQIKDLFN